MEAADKEADVEAKRGLLDQVAKSTGVDQARRTRAASALAGLNDAGTMEIDELPESSTSGATNTAATPTNAPKPLSPLKRPSGERTSTSPKKAQSQTPPHDSPTLVRDDPFSSPNDQSDP